MQVHMFSMLAKITFLIHVFKFMLAFNTYAHTSIYRYKLTAPYCIHENALIYISVGVTNVNFVVGKKNVFNHHTDAYIIETYIVVRFEL